MSGEYRFRRSWNNVDSKFYGARPTTHPNVPRRRDSNNGDGGGCVYFPVHNVVSGGPAVNDRSGSALKGDYLNHNVLYSGRFPTYDGVTGSLTVPTVSYSKPVTKITALVKSSTDSTWTTSLGNVNFTANDTWQYVKLEAVSNPNPTSLTFNDGFAGSCSDIKIYSGNEIIGNYQQNESADSGGTGIVGITAFDAASGFHGTYSGNAGSVVAQTGEPDIIQSALQSWNAGSLVNPLPIEVAGTYSWAEFTSTETGFDGISDGNSRCQSQDFYSLLGGASEYLVSFFVDNQTGSAVSFGDYSGSSGGGGWGPSGPQSIPNGFSGVVSETFEVGAVASKRLRFIADGTQGPISTSNLSIIIPGGLIPESIKNHGFDAVGNVISRSRKLNELNFFGDGEHGSLGDDPSLDLTDEATWVFTSEIFGVPPEDFHLLASHNISQPYGWLIAKSASGAEDEIDVILSDNGTTITTRTFSGITEGEHTFGVVFDGSQSGASDKLKVYMDGNLLESSGDTLTLTSLNVSGLPVTVGCSDEAESPVDLKMTLNGIYNRALSEVEVRKFKYEPIEPEPEVSTFLEDGEGNLLEDPEENLLTL